MIDIAFLKNNNLIIFECISGSKAYGLATPQSDTDIKGVFVLPRDLYYGFEPIEQVVNETNDIIYYELKKFLFLLGRNNPTILEMLYSPAECILQQNPLFDLVLKKNFLSKLCRETFANYAYSQIKKAKGLNKKIMNPVGKKKKSILDFCYVTAGAKSLPLEKWLKQSNYRQENCGLSALANFQEFYALYYDPDGKHALNGIIKKGEKSNDVCLSSVPKELNPVGYLYYNKEDYKGYIKKYHEYWDWVKHRNETRYESTIRHEKNYDAKNMMHTIRLLLIAEEIAVEKTIHVQRLDREFLLAIKNGEYEYDEIIRLAEEKIEKVNRLFEQSDLPETPDAGVVERLAVEIRKEFYGR